MSRKVSGCPVKIIFLICGPFLGFSVSKSMFWVENLYSDHLILVISCKLRDRARELASIFSIMPGQRHSVGSVLWDD